MLDDGTFGEPVCTGQRAAWHVPEDTGHGFYLDFWVAKCRADGNHIVLPLLE